MSSLAELRKALADAVSGKGDPPLNAYPSSPADVITPAAVVEPEEVDWTSTPATFRRGNEEWQLSLFVLVAPITSPDDPAAGEARDQFFDRSSNDIKDAIESASDGQFTVAGADRWGAFGFAGRMFAGFRYRITANN